MAGINLKRPNLTRQRLSARTKLTLILIAVAVTAVFVVGYSSWQGSRVALNATISQQLATVRSSKARQIEMYFQSLRSHLQILSEDETIIAAMVRFNKAYRDLDREHIPPLWDIRLETYYDREFFPRLSENLAGTPEYDNYKPRSQAASYLQYQYLATNVEPVGNKQALDFARDESAYSDYHADYHPWLRDLTEKFGYYDLFLIDYETGNIVYSVKKEVDFATSIMTGPYRHSGLADVVQAVQENPARHAIQIVDFAPYQPSYNAPAAFVGAPIYNGPHVIGILALQFPSDQLNRIMNGDREWQADGLGRSGEAYIVGSDYLMRSQSRLLLEDVTKYKARLAASGLAAPQIAQIERLNSSILLQPVRTTGTAAALAGETDTRVIENYAGISVLSVLMPLQLEGLNWVLITEMETAEAFAPITGLTRNLIVATVIVVAILTFIAVLLSSTFLQPLLSLLAGTRRLHDGDEAIEFGVYAQDEFGELAQSFHQLLKTAHTEIADLAEKNREYSDLLMSNLPETVVERFASGERYIVDQVSRATVLFVRITDDSDRMVHAELEATAALINELDDAFHEAADRHDLELFKLIGQQYVAVCGLSTQRLDHARRAVDLAISMLNILNNFNLTNEGQLSFQAGIDSGTVMGGIIGNHTFSYDLWGNAVRLAQEAESLAAVNEIIVTAEVYEQVRELYEFSQNQATVSQYGRAMSTWRLITTSGKPPVSNSATNSSTNSVGQSAGGSRI
ncbi:MAG: adenylate/guanylate cyclase domain-containing protein [Caldilineaceae bacterium]